MRYLILVAIVLFVGCDQPVDTSLESARVTYLAELSRTAKAGEESVSIQQQMLDELRKISDQTSTLAPSASPPQEPTPEAAPDPEPVQQAPPEASQRQFTLHGQLTDADQFIGQWYSREWTHPGEVADHLIEHGVKDYEVQQFSQDELMRLHASIHEYELATKGRTDNRPVVLKQPSPAMRQEPARFTPAYQSCPGGNCPANRPRKWR